MALFFNGSKTKITTVAKKKPGDLPPVSATFYLVLFWYLRDKHGFYYIGLT